MVSAMVERERVNSADRRLKFDLPGLRRERFAQRMTQRELSLKSGVSANTIVLLENGTRGAYPPTVDRLAHALNVPTDALMRA